MSDQRGRFVIEMLSMNLMIGESIKLCSSNSSVLVLGQWKIKILGHW